MLYGILADRIHVSFKPVVTVEGLIVFNGMVLYAGRREKIESFVRELGGEIIDYGDKTIIPGFIDPHLHLDSIAFEDNMVDLRGLKNIGEILGEIRDYLREKPYTRAIIGRGWDQDKLAEKRPPYRHELDSISKDKPILLVRICGHMAVANTPLLKMLENTSRGVDADKGFLYEEAVSKALKIIEEYVTIDARDIIEKTIEIARSKGITCFGWMSASLEKVLSLAKTVLEENRITPHIRFYLKPQDFIEWANAGIPPKTLNIDGVKILADGSLGARTAYLSKPYSDKRDTMGTLNISRNELLKIIQKALENGYHTAIHAIGDKTLDIVIEAYSSLKAYGERIEHASLIREDQLTRLAELKPRIVIQPGFILSDTWLVDRIGLERIKWAYRISSLIKKDIIVGFSSDAPVEPPDPWRNIYAAITRGYYEGLDIARHTRSEAIDIETALYLHTEGSAKTLFLANRGCLKPRYYADYIVLDKDPLETTDPRELFNIRIIETRIAGHKL